MKNLLLAFLFLSFVFVSFASVEVVDIGPKSEIKTVLSQDLVISDFQNFVLFEAQASFIFIDERAMINCVINQKAIARKTIRLKGRKVDYSNYIKFGIINDLTCAKKPISVNVGFCTTINVFDYSYNKLLKQS